MRAAVARTHVKYIAWPAVTQRKTRKLPLAQTICLYVGNLLATAVVSAVSALVSDRRVAGRPWLSRSRIAPQRRLAVLIASAAPLFLYLCLIKRL